LLEFLIRIPWEGTPPKAHPQVSSIAPKNDRIAATGYVWALAAVRHDPHWNARYRARRQNGDRHVAALRRLFNLMLGKLHHCLQHNTVYDPAKAFADFVAVAA
jgi:hypothetical protein